MLRHSPELQVPESRKADRGAGRVRPSTTPHTPTGPRRIVAPDVRRSDPTDPLDCPNAPGSMWGVELGPELRGLGLLHEWPWRRALYQLAQSPVQEAPASAARTTCRSGVPLSQRREGDLGALRLDRM